MSLIKTLNDKIKEAGYLSIEEIYQICEDDHFKQSNAERRLRKSESPNIAPVYNDKPRYIKGYQWTGKEIGSPEVYEDKRQLLSFN